MEYNLASSCLQYIHGVICNDIVDDDVACDVSPHTYLTSATVGFIQYCFESWADHSVHCQDQVSELSLKVLKTDGALSRMYAYINAYRWPTLCNGTFCHLLAYYGLHKVWQFGLDE